MVELLVVGEGGVWMSETFSDKLPTPPFHMQCLRLLRCTIYRLVCSLIHATTLLYNMVKASCASK